MKLRMSAIPVLLHIIKLLFSRFMFKNYINTHQNVSHKEKGYSPTHEVHEADVRP